MFRKTYHATHPDMMAGASNEQLRERYLIADLFAAGQVVAELLAQRALRDRRRRADHGAGVAAGADRAGLGRRQAVPGAPRAGHRQRRRRHRHGHGRRHRATRCSRKDGLYVPMGSARGRVRVERRRPTRRKFYLASTPAHARFETKHISIDAGRAAGARRAGNLERAHDLPVHRPGHVQVLPAAARPDRPQAGQRVEHDAAAPARPPLRGLFLLRPRPTSASCTSWASRPTCATW